MTMSNASNLNEALDRLMSLSNANTDLVYARSTLKRLLDNHSLDKKTEKKLRDFVFSLEGITGLLYHQIVEIKQKTFGITEEND